MSPNYCIKQEGSLAVCHLGRSGFELDISVLLIGREIFPARLNVFLHSKRRQGRGACQVRQIV